MCMCVVCVCRQIDDRKTDRYLTGDCLYELQANQDRELKNQIRKGKLIRIYENKDYAW